MEVKKSIAKKLTAIVLALVMIISTVPLVFAAPTGPVEKTRGDHQNAVDTGSYVSMRADYQNFTFIQTEDNQQFQFSFVFGAMKNQGFNYGWIYHQREQNQTLKTPIGKSFTINWSRYQEGLPGNLFGGNTWSDATITINFVAEGAKVYDTALRVKFDGRPTDGGGPYVLIHDIPLKVTVLDKRALNSAIAEAKAKSVDMEYFTDDSWSTLTTYLSQAQDISGNVVVPQSKIDQAVSNLNAAVEGLYYKDADYSALNSAIAAAQPVIDTPNADEIYTADSLKKLADAYTAATSVEQGLNIKRQAEVTNAATALQSAVDSLVRFADYKALKAAVNNFNKLNARYFDPGEFSKVKVLADKAKENLKPENKLPETKQEQIDAQAHELNAAIAALKMLPADYAEFDRAVSQAKVKLAADDILNYTPSSVAALEEAYLAAAKVEKGKDITYQATVDAATAQIASAMKGLTLKGADYSKLDAAIEKAKAELQRSDLNDFTAESVAALRAALTEAQNVNRELAVDNQKTIDAARDTLVSKTHLVLKGADYSKLDKAIENRTAELSAAKASGKYTEASMTRLQMAINVAKSVDRTYSIKEQSVVNDAVGVLNSVVLEKKAADTRALEAAIEKAQQTLNEAGDEYTAESKQALNEAIKQARQTLAQYGNDIDNQDKIDAAVKTLESVKLTLKGADYAALDAAIAEAEAFLADPENAKLYTPEALEKLRTELENAKNLDRSLTIKEQAQVTAALSALDAAMPGESGYNPADTAALTEAIAKADKLLAKEDIADYTEDSVAALRAARDEAAALLETKPNITQQAVVAEKATALAAMELTLKGADYSKLEKAVEDAQAKLDEARKSGNYTEESLNALENAIADANAILDTRDLTIKEQAQVDAIAEGLETAVPGEGNYKDADLQALNAAIAAAQAKVAADDYSNYTPETKAAYENLIAQAIVLRDSQPNITKQAEVNALADKLAAFELLLLDADYAKLDEAIANADKLLTTNLSDKFTQTSITNLKRALADAKNVERDLKITQQAVIDEATALLNEAMGNLKSYDKITDVQITHGGAVVDGDVAFEKVTWYKKYKSHSTTLGYKSNGEAVSVTWELANWSVDKPEATIVDNGDGTVTITPNGKGIGARSVWVKVTVTDVNGNTSSDYVKVRFYKWWWQAK